MTSRIRDGERRSRTRAGLALLVVPIALAGCGDSADDDRVDQARDELFQALQVSQQGGPAAEQMRHLDRCLALLPDAGDCLRSRAGLHFALGRPEAALSDLDRAIATEDRPYLRFERADVRCARGEVSGALEDLDFAIAAQPENLQFYHRRALAYLAAGRAADARRDLAIVDPERRTFPWAAADFVDGDFARSVSGLDFLIDSASEGETGILRALRLVASEALSQAGDSSGDSAEEHTGAQRDDPRAGYTDQASAQIGWLEPRSCQNAFLVLRGAPWIPAARDLLEARAIEPGAARPSSTADAMASGPDGRKPDAPNEDKDGASATVTATVGILEVTNPSDLLPVAPLWIVSRNGDTIEVELDASRRPASVAPATLQIVDRRGVRSAARVAVREACAADCGEADAMRCLPVADYRVSGLPAEPDAIAFESGVAIEAQPIARETMTREEQLTRLASLFREPLSPPIAGEWLFAWQREQGAETWSEVLLRNDERLPGETRIVREVTGLRFDACRLAEIGPFVEIACPFGSADSGQSLRKLFLEGRYVGANDDPSLETLVGHAARIGDSIAWVTSVASNSVTQRKIFVRRGDVWRMFVLASARPSC